MITITTINNSWYFLGDLVIKPNSSSTYQEENLSKNQAKDLLESVSSKRVSLSSEDLTKVQNRYNSFNSGGNVDLSGIISKIENIYKDDGGGVRSGVLVDEIDERIAADLDITTDISIVRNLAEINQLNINERVLQADFEVLSQTVADNGFLLEQKAFQSDLDALAIEVSTKATPADISAAIAALVDGAPASLNTLAEIATALAGDQATIADLLAQINNRVRFDATQSLTTAQQLQARQNINAEQIGVAAALVSAITATSIGAATALQGTKADSALQSGDVAPVALSGSYTDLINKPTITNPVNADWASNSGLSQILNKPTLFGLSSLLTGLSAGSNSAIAATDTLINALAKLQAQVNARGLKSLAEVLNTAAPNAPVPVVGIKPNRSETNVDLVLSSKGTGAITAQVPDGSTTGGNKRGMNAVDLQMGRNNSNQVASGAFSVAMGGNNTASVGYSVAIGGGNTATGTYSVAMGGDNTASGSPSVAMGSNNTASSAYAVAMGGNNTASGNCSLAMGYSNTALSSYSVAMGGNNSASGDYSLSMGQSNAAQGVASVALGRLNVASGYCSIALGNNNASSGTYSVALGSNSDASGSCSVAMGNLANTRGVPCATSQGWHIDVPGFSSGTRGSYQSAVYPLWNGTMGATPVSLFTGVDGFGVSNPVPLIPNNHGWAFEATVCARSPNDFVVWDIKGAVVCNSSGVATLVGTPTITQRAATSAVSWSVSVGIKTISGGKAVDFIVTGAASTKIAWNATMRTIETIC